MNIIQEVAQNFKEQGNEYFKEKRYREALGFYTQGVDAQPTDTVLQEALLCNRAACNLELGKSFCSSSLCQPFPHVVRFNEENFGSVLRDCSTALAINSQSSKALYRAATALIALDRAEEALEYCDRCLSFDKNNRSVQAVRQQAENAQAARHKKEEERLQNAQRENKTRRLLSSALQVRVTPIVDIANTIANVSTLFRNVISSWFSGRRVLASRTSTRRIRRMGR